MPNLPVPPPPHAAMLKKPHAGPPVAHDVLLSVTYVSQTNIGGSLKGTGGRAEKNGCWYAAVQMLGYYREVGPRLGVPQQYVQSNGAPREVTKEGIQPLPMGDNYLQLVANERLASIPLPADKTWTCEKLAALLRHCGPLYVRTKVLDKDGVHTHGHIVVLIGAKPSRQTVIVHDPARGPNIEQSIGRFNRRLNWDDSRSFYTLMYKPRAEARKPAIKPATPRHR